jgi:hypothetical protein
MNTYLYQRITSQTILQGPIKHVEFIDSIKRKSSFNPKILPVRREDITGLKSNPDGSYEKNGIPRTGRDNSKKYNILVISGSIGSRDFSRTTKERLEEYCLLHGYSLLYFRQLIKEYNLFWQRVPYFYVLLNSTKVYDYMVWLDDDIYITNKNIKIEDFIDLQEVKNASLIIGQDIDYYSIYDIMLFNSGLFIVKHSDVMKKFYYRLLKGYDEYLYFQNYGFHEQSIMIYLYYESYSKDISILPRGILQSYYFHQSWLPGDLQYTWQD